MTSALVIGGTGFSGRHTAMELLDHGYEVTTLSRSTPDAEFTDQSNRSHITVDRTDTDALADAAQRVDPEIVIDCAAFYPDDVQTALEIFADIDAYVYVSSGAVYSVQEIPKREDETPLRECTPEQADDGSMASYGPRKAECDRITTQAAERGVRRVAGGVPLRQTSRAGNCQSSDAEIPRKRRLPELSSSVRSSSLSSVILARFVVRVMG